jgi:hypothetical protein
MLRPPPSRFGSLDREGLERLPHQLVIVAVGPVDGGPERDAAAVGQHQALHPALAAVGGVAAGFFPHPAAPCPSPRPRPAKPSQCPAARRRPAGPRARRPRTPRRRPTPGTVGAPTTRSRSSSRAVPSTGMPSAARRRSHPSPHGPAPAGCGSPAGVAVVAAATAPSWPRVRPATASRHPERAAWLLSVQSLSSSQVDGKPRTDFLPG